MITITIPDKFYVTFSKRENGEIYLGFASPYTKDAAFEKRKITQDYWAYPKNYDSGIVIDSDDNIIVNNDSIAEDVYPKIISNCELSGFQISKTIRRFGWNGSGNVKWRIADPRGFDLEISSENFGQIVATTTIINGEIQGKCVWGRAGANNILLPVDSEPYKRAKHITENLSKTFSIKDINIGDIVEVRHDRDIIKAKYCGKLYLLGVSTLNFCDYRFNKSQSSQYIFEYMDERLKNIYKYFLKSTTPKIVSIIQPAENVITLDEIAKRINLDLINHKMIRNAYSCYGVSSTHINLDKDIEIKLVPLNETSLLNEEQKLAYQGNLIFKQGKEFNLQEYHNISSVKYIKSIDKTSIIFETTTGRDYFPSSILMRDKLMPITKYISQIELDELPKYVVEIYFGDNSVIWRS